MNFALSSMKVTSSAFKEGERIPTRHTGEGEDVSPALAWTDAPDGAQGYAVICHDPDAPVVSGGNYGFDHWVLYNIPGSVTSLAEGTSEHTNGVTGFGGQKYGGPMPPNGHGSHRYFFWVLALNEQTDLAPGLSLPALLEAIESRVIGMNRLVGTYHRD